MWKEQVESLLTAPMFQENSYADFRSSSFQITAFPDDALSTTACEAQKIIIQHMPTENIRRTCVSATHRLNMVNSGSWLVNTNHPACNVVDNRLILNDFHNVALEDKECDGTWFQTSPALFFEMPTNESKGWMYTYSGNFYQFTTDVSPRRYH